MERDIQMSDNIPGYTSRKIDTNLILRQFPDGGYQLDDNFCHLFNLSPAEFNRLAMEAPIVKRMVAKLAQLDNFYPNDEELERLIEDIAELEGMK